MDQDQAKKILQEYHSGLSERKLKILEKNTEWASAINERSLFFQQFLFSLEAAILAIFFSVEQFNELIINDTIFHWAVGLFAVSLILFILSFKEKIDEDSLNLVKDGKKSEDDFNNGYSIFQKQIKNGINIDAFYRDLQYLVEDNQKKKIELEKESLKNPGDYSLELFITLLFSSLWFLFFSTKNWFIFYLYIGLIIIIYFSSNQNRFFYKIVKAYSRTISKIFPIKNS